MKEEIETAITEFTEELTFAGNPLVEDIVTGQADKPSGLSTMLIDFKDPVGDSEEYNRGLNLQVEGDGEIYFIFKIELENASELNDVVPEIVFDEMRKDPTLGGRIPGDVTPKKLKAGVYELKNTDGVFFYMSLLIFNYKGRWIPPRRE